jgi:hypothetical protein
MGKGPSHKKSSVRMPQWARDQDKFSKNKKKYPNCKGTFPDCPEIIVEGTVDNGCKMCPFYK